jgi:hypothetical protein
MAAVLADISTPAVARLLGDSPGLTRDEEEHVYKFQGRVVPGITRLMEPIHSYDGVPEWILERKAHLGSCVHLATELWDNDDLAEDSLSPDLVPYLEAWKTFRKENAGRIHAVEPKLYHAGMGYAGQPDRCMQIDTDYDVLEIKTTSRLFNAVGVQLMAQKHLLESAMPGMRIGKRIAIQLKADGRYQLREYKDPHDWPVFVALLSVHNWNTRYHGK